MSYLFITGIAFYLAGIFLARKMDVKGIQMLNAEQVEMLGTNFIRLRKRNSIANIILAFAYLGAVFLNLLDVYTVIICYVIIYLVIFFIAANSYIRGLKRLSFPPVFIRNFISAKFIRVLAFGIFIATLVGAIKTMEGA